MNYKLEILLSLLLSTLTLARPLKLFIIYALLEFLSEFFKAISLRLRATKSNKISHKIYLKSSKDLFLRYGSLRHKSITKIVQEDLLLIHFLDLWRTLKRTLKDLTMK